MADLAKRQRWRYAKNIIEGSSALTEQMDGDTFTESKAKKNLIDRLIDIELRAQQGKKIPEKELNESFIWAGTHIYASHEDEYFLVQKLVSIPYQIFTSKVMEFGISIWVWISRARPSVHARMFAEIAKNWEWTVRRRKGLFSSSLKYSPQLITLLILVQSVRFRGLWNIGRLICNDGQNESTLSKNFLLPIY